MRRPLKPYVKTFLTTQAFFLVFFLGSQPVQGSYPAGTFVQEDDTIHLLTDLVFSIRQLELRVENPSSGIQYYQDGIIYLIDTKNDPKNPNAFSCYSCHKDKMEGLWVHSPVSKGLSEA